jgi:VWFA-related protein
VLPDSTRAADFSGGSSIVSFGRSLRICLSLSLAVASASAIAAQSSGQSTPPAVQTPSQEPPIAVSPAPTSRPGEDRIHLDVVVDDKASKAVSGLELKDFTLLDNNLPGKILSFRAVDDPMQKAAPVQAILVLDAINQEHQTVALEREQVDAFLHQNGGHLSVPVSVLLFTDAGLKVLANPSLDGNAVAAQLDKAETGFRMITRAAGAYGAVELVGRSVDAFNTLSSAESTKPGRKLIIWIGPGWPLLDSPRFETSASGQQKLFETIVHMSAGLREAHISVYDVSEGLPGPRTFLYQYFLKGVNSVQKAALSNLQVKVLATQSGGLAVGPDNDLTSQLATCVQDAVPYYTLSFDPPRADKPNEYHELKIQIARPGLTARTSTGYYDQP